MRVVLDACVPKRLSRALAALEGVEVQTVHALGWSDVDDGALLDLLEGQCDALITVDRNMPFQQQLRHRRFGVLVLRARSNRLEDLVPWVPALGVALSGLGPGEVRWVPPLPAPT